MKFLVEIKIRDDHPLLHRKHINSEAVIKDTIERQLAILESAEITVKKATSKKK